MNPTDIQKKEIKNIIGDIKMIDEDLQEFRRNTRVLSSHRARLISKYPQKWVAIYRGKVRASATSLNAVLADVERLGLSRSDVIVRYIDRTVRKMIL